MHIIVYILGPTAVVIFFYILASSYCRADSMTSILKNNTVQVQILDRIYHLSHIPVGMYLCTPQRIFKYGLFREGQWHNDSVNGLTAASPVVFKTASNKMPTATQQSTITSNGYISFVCTVFIFSSMWFEVSCYSLHSSKPDSIIKAHERLHTSKAKIIACQCYSIRFVTQMETASAVCPVLSAQKQQDVS